MGDSYSQEELDRLISCPKKVKLSPKNKMSLERGSYRNDMSLMSSDGELEFRVFMRKNADFHENFSLGIDFKPRDGTSLCLLRCNGPHGSFEGEPRNEKWHFFYHIHRAKIKNIEAGVRAEQGGEPTREYASFEDALPFFLKIINLQEYRKYFSDFFAPNLPLGDSE